MEFKIDWQNAEIVNAEDMNRIEANIQFLDDVLENIKTDGIKSPHSLQLQLNGIPQKEYDGSTEQVINITSESVGAAATEHTHSKDEIIDLSISHVGPSEPSDKNIFWIDTSTGGVLKYWNGSAWTPLKAVWG